jgi:hypothetical protein
VLVDRCALFVDASYMLGDGAMAVHGTRRRDSVSWDYAGLLKLLSGLCGDSTGLPLLRCYWYEATVEGRRTTEHDTLADLAHLKLRLGRLRPGRREGVEGEMHRDLIALAKNGAITEAVVVSGDEDLTEVISEVQQLGVRVLIGGITVDGGWTISRPLRQECDEVLEISGAHLRPFVDLIPGAEPRRDDDYASGYPSPGSSANGHGTLGAVTRHGLPAAALPAPPLYNAPVLPDSHAGAGQGGAIPGGAIPGGGSHAAPSGLGGPSNGLPQRGSGRPRQQADGAAPLGGSRQANLPSPDPLSGPLPGSTAAGGRHSDDQASRLPGSTPFPPLDQFHDRLPDAGSNGSAASQPPAAPGSGARHGGGQAGRGSSVTQQYQQPGYGGSADPLSLPSFSGPPGQPAPGGQAGPQSQPGPQPAQQGASGQLSHSGPIGHPSGPIGHHSGPIGPAAGMGQSGIGTSSGIGQSGQMGQTPSMGQGGGAMGQGGMPSQGMTPPPMGQQGSSQQGSSQPGPMGGGTSQPGSLGQGQQGLNQQGLNQQGLNQQDLGQSGLGQQNLGQQNLGQGQAGGLGGSGNGLSQGSGLGPSFGSGPNQFTSPQPGGGPVPQPVAVSLADAVQAAHSEGFGFGEAVARDAPALWLEAVLARKPRMPSDLEARLLQGSALPIDSLLHDEVRHALRRGFWDALERSRR